MVKRMDLCEWVALTMPPWKVPTIGLTSAMASDRHGSGQTRVYGTDLVHLDSAKRDLSTYKTRAKIRTTHARHLHCQQV
jgi:hypothetical protein